MRLITFASLSMLACRVGHVFRCNKMCGSSQQAAYPLFNRSLQQARNNCMAFLSNITMYLEVKQQHTANIALQDKEQSTC